MGVLKYLIQFIGPALFVLIFIKFVDTEMFIHTIKAISLKYFFISSVFVLFLHLGKLFRMHFFLRKNGITITLSSLAKIYVYAFFVGQMSNIVFSDITSAGILMMKDAKKKLRISNIFLFNRIADTFFISLLFITSLFINLHLLEPYFQVRYQKIIITVVIFFLGGITILYFKTKFLLLLKDFFLTVKSFWGEMIILSAFIYFCYTIAAMYLVKAFALNLSLSFVIFNFTLGTLISVLPISISGIGTRDISFIAILNLINVSSEKAVAISSLGYIVLPFLSVSLIYLVSIIGPKYENSHHR